MNEGMNDIQIENKVKTLIPEKQIGHFSRAFVDHGRFRYVAIHPTVANVIPKHSCPTT